MSSGATQRREEDRTANRGESVEQAAELEQITRKAAARGYALLDLQAKGFKIDSRLCHHFGIKHRRHARAAFGVIFAVRLRHADQRLGGRLNRLDLRDK